MKLIIIFCFCFLFTQQCEAQYFFFKEGKLDLTDSFKIERNFQYFVKSRLGIYANEYNSIIMQEVNKMKDYITYEDSTIITSVVKFQPKQTLQATLWDAEVIFEKKGDTVVIKFEKLKIAKYLGIAGEATLQDAELNELRASKMQKSMLRKLKERIDIFFNKFENQEN